MKNISSYYNLGVRQPDLNFLDIKLDSDNLFFIDPRLIEVSENETIMEMYIYVQKFWGELIKAVKKKDNITIDKLLLGLKEPHETRLGYSVSKKSGNSVGGKLKPNMIEAITKNKAIQSGVLSHMADAELFIEDISSDRISDILTKVIKSCLIEYTQKNCILYNIPMVLVKQDDIFDINDCKWKKTECELPIHLGKPIIFVPKEIVRLKNGANKNIGCLYRFAIRHFIYNDLNMLEDISPSGKDGQLLIKDVQAYYPVSKESLTNWVNKYGKLLVDYKANKKYSFTKTLSDLEIMNVIYEDDDLGLQAG